MWVPSHSCHKAATCARRPGVASRGAGRFGSYAGRALPLEGARMSCDLRGLPSHALASAAAACAARGCCWRVMRLMLTNHQIPVSRLGGRGLRRRPPAWPEGLAHVRWRAPPLRRSAGKVAAARVLIVARSPWSAVRGDARPSSRRAYRISFFMEFRVYRLGLLPRSTLSERGLFGETPSSHY